MGYNASLNLPMRNLNLKTMSTLELAGIGLNLPMRNLNPDC